MLIDSWEDLLRRVPKTPKGVPRAEYIDNWLKDHSGIPVKDIKAARQARNSAAHDVREITLAEMYRALKIIDKIEEQLDQDS